MDSYALREEQSLLIKSVSELKHKIETGNIRVKELHDEEIRYLEEIPKFKKQAEYEKSNILKLESQGILLKKELEFLIKELNEVKVLIIKGKNELQDSIARKIENSKEISDSNININRRISAVQTREISVDIREKDCYSRELFNKKVESDLDNREVNISNKERALEHGHNELLNEINLHKKNLDIYTEKINSIAQQRKFLEEDKQILRDKLGNVDKLIKENCDLKVKLLSEIEIASKSIKRSEDKNIMLDKAITDLTNQENSLKIKDLRIRKMAHDAGLQKELKELEESLK